MSEVLSDIRKNLTVALLANATCNIKCNHCYLPYSNDRPPEDLLNLVSKLKNDGHRINITGSEPILNIDYLKAFEEVKQTSIPTNGIALDNDESFYDELKQHGINRIKISYHYGIQKQLQSVPKEIVFRVINRALERGFRVAVLTTITTENYNQVKEMCKEVYQSGAERVILMNFILSGRGQALNDFMLSPKQKEELFQQVLETRKLYNKDDFYISIHGNFGPRIGSPGEKLSKSNMYCRAGIDTIAIDPNGNIYGCPFTAEKGYEIGQYKDGQIKVYRQILPEHRQTCIANLIRMGNLPAKILHEGSREIGKSSLASSPRCCNEVPITLP